MGLTKASLKSFLLNRGTLSWRNKNDRLYIFLNENTTRMGESGVKDHNPLNYPEV